MSPSLVELAQLRRSVEQGIRVLRDRDRKHGDAPRTNVYFPAAILDELMAESVRLERTPSWLMRRAWQIARGEILLWRPRASTSPSR